MNGADVTEAGVNALVDRLHRDGVEAGRQEATRLIEAARTEAGAILDAARAERDLMLAEAERRSEALRRSGEAALELAMRDTLLRAREALGALLAERLGAHVGAVLADRALLARLVGWAARCMTGQADAEDERRLMVEVGGGPRGEDDLALLLELLDGDLATREPELRLAGDRPGVVLRREGEALAVELTDETLTAFLFAQLQPRFRAMFEGVRR